MTIAWIDFETRSRCNLLTKGAYNYALDASTEVLCLCYAFDDGEVQTWLPGTPLPDFTGYQLRAHNAAFDRRIMTYVMEQDYPLEQWYCTAAQARANCFPGSLADVGRAASSQMRKDHRGGQLIRLLSIPQADGSFNNDPTLMQEMIDYCAQDVRTMREVSKALRQLADEELADYHINERINEQGVLIDLDLCRAAIGYSDAENIEIQAIVAEVTQGEVTSVRSPRMRQWVQDRVGPEAIKLMTFYKDGEAKMSIDKDVRANLLALADEDPDEVPEDVAEVIQCADDMWASSVAKFKRLADLADEEDHRVRGAFVFNGGSATGRASSYGAQVHNFTRKCAKKPDEVREAMVRGEAIVPAYGSRVIEVLKGMLRPSMVPAPGKVFVVADWSAIEGRVNPWLSNCPWGEEKLELYRAKKDPYIVNAAALFGLPYGEIKADYDEKGTSDMRQTGKVQELALGFLGGVGAFDKFSKGMGLTEAFKQKAVKSWRRVNPWAMHHGQELERAYLRAMRNKGHAFAAGRVTYLFDGQHLWYALPSGRVLCYPYARLEEDGVSYMKASWKPKVDAKEWPRGRLWRGLAIENATQATANDLLRHALRQVDMCVLHIHDEIVLEVPEANAQQAGEHLARVMTTPPAWAEGLPLAVEWKVMRRYGK